MTDIPNHTCAVENGCKACAVLLERMRKGARDKIQANAQEVADRFIREHPEIIDTWDRAEATRDLQEVIANFACQQQGLDRQ